MRYHNLLSTLTVTLLLVLPQLTLAQTYQKDQTYQKGYVHQKGDPGRNPESGDEPDEPPAGGAYARPPGTGGISGASRGIGIEGLEIEFPTLRLKLPAIRIPGLSRFAKPPRMHLDPDTAPYVSNVVRQTTIPDSGGAPESGDEGPRAPESGDEPSQKPFQKVSHGTFDEHRNGSHTTHNARSPADSYAAQFEARERALEARVQELQSSIELLLANQRALAERAQTERTSSRSAPRKLRVEFTHFMERIPAPTNELRRLPRIQN